MALIKRYANRKLYDTASGRYITLEEIAALVREGEDVRVVDHASGNDLTSLVLLQVFLAEERRLGELLPRAAITHLLRSGEERVEPLRARLLAAFDPRKHLEEELQRRFDRLVKRGVMDVKDADRLRELLLRDEEEETAPEEDAMRPEALEVLRRQLEELERELADLRRKKQ